jgi:hypothetical protein
MRMLISAVRCLLPRTIVSGSRRKMSTAEMNPPASTHTQMSGATATSRADLRRARPHPRFPLHDRDSLNRLAQALGISVRFSHALFDRRCGRPIFLISNMAMHTQNIQADPRASLFVCQGGDGDPLGTARATLVGDVLPVPEMKLARLANAICRATRTAAPGWTSKTLAFTACSRWTFTMSAASGSWDG